MIVAQSPILPPVMGRVCSLSSTASVKRLCRGEGKAALGSVAAAWSFSPLHQHCESWSQHVTYRWGYRTHGNKFQLCCPSWHVRNTWCVSETQRFNISFYVRRRENWFHCKPCPLQPPLSPSYIYRDTFKVRSVLQGHTDAYGEDLPWQQQVHSKGSHLHFPGTDTVRRTD